MSVKTKVVPLVERKPRPVVKWAGGKRQLLPELLKRAPVAFDRYVEPFVGGGALFWELSSIMEASSRPMKAALLADANVELIDAYLAIRDSAEVESVIAKLRKMQARHSKNYYYEVRSQSTAKLKRPDHAARFIYLNKTCFNGLYRVNRKNQFNVPIGKFKSPPIICDEENLRACHRALQGIAVWNADFRDTLREVERGDFVYIDPPYVPTSETANFTSFTATKFTMEDQKKLVEEIRRIKSLGAKVLVSAAGNKATRKLYDGFHVEEVGARRNINSAPEFRDAVTELLIT